MYVAGTIVEMEIDKHRYPVIREIISLNKKGRK